MVLRFLEFRFIELIVESACAESYLFRQEILFFLSYRRLSQSAGYTRDGIPADLEEIQPSFLRC